MEAKLHLIKLCVGVEHPQELIDWQDRRRAETGIDHAFHVTRMWPRRADELLSGGSLYWVMKGMIRARQKVLGLEERIGTDGIRRCAIILHENVVQTEMVRRRAFQGWRYLSPDQAPADIAGAATDTVALPDALSHALAEMGVR